MIAWSVEEEALGGIPLGRKHLAPWIRAYKSAVLEMLAIEPETIMKMISKQTPLVLRVLMCGMHEYLAKTEDADPDPFVKEAFAQICLNDGILLGGIRARAMRLT